MAFLALIRGTDTIWGYPLYRVILSVAGIACVQVSKVREAQVGAWGTRMGTDSRS
jgi:hypothetical protein